MIKNIGSNAKPQVVMPATKGNKTATIMLSDKFLDMIKDKGDDNKK